MENISCMRFKYLCEFLTEIGDTYTDKNGKSFRISRSARNKLSTLRLCKIDSAKTVRATYDPSSNAVDLTVSGYVYDHRQGISLSTDQKTRIDFEKTCGMDQF